MFIFLEIGLIDWNDSMVFKNDPAYFVQISHFTPEVKNLILELGPCQPVGEDLPKKMFPKDMTKDKRSFKETFYFRILPFSIKLVGSMTPCDTFLDSGDTSLEME